VKGQTTRYMRRCIELLNGKVIAFGYAYPTAQKTSSHFLAGLSTKFVSEFGGESCLSYFLLIVIVFEAFHLHNIFSLLFLFSDGSLYFSLIFLLFVYN